MSASNSSFVVKNGLVVNSNLIYAASGKVGINTTTPDTVLTVAGTANVQGNVTVTQNIFATAVVSNTYGIHFGNVAASSVNASANVFTNTVFATNVNATVVTSNTVGIHTGNVSATVVNASANVYTNTVFATNVNATTVNTTNINATSAALTGNMLVGGTLQSLGTTTVGNSSVTADLYVTGNLQVAGTTVAIGNTSAQGPIVPATSESFVLGNSTYTWSALYSKELIVGNTTSFGSVNSTAFSGTSANSTLFAGQSLATVQGWVTGNAATAYSNGVTYADGKAATAYSNATTYADGKAATAYSNATTYADGKAATAFTNAVANAVANTSQAYANSTNGLGISGTAANANTLGGVAAASYVNTSGAYTITGLHTYNANVFVNVSTLSIGNSTSNVSVNTTIINIGNSTVNSTINATSFTGKANDAVNYTGTITSGQVTTGLGYTPYNSATNTDKYSNATNNFGISGTAANATLFAAQSLATVQGWITGNAATAYSNGVTYTDSKAATAFSNAVANAVANAATFSSNATNITTGTLDNARLPSSISVTTVTANHSGNGAGLTSVNYNSQSSYNSAVAVFNAGDGGVWQNTSPRFYPTLPSNINTLYASFQVDLFVKQVADAVASSGDLGYGGGNPEFAYRVVKGTDAGANTVLFTSEWSTLSTAGSGTAFLTTIKDSTPIAGNSVGYAIQYQWRPVSSNPNANAGTLTVANSTTLAVTGTGTFWQGTLNPRLEIASPSSSTTWVKIDTVLGKGSLTTTTALGTKAAQTYKVRDLYANVVMSQTNVLVTFNGFC